MNRKEFEQIFYELYPEMVHYALFYVDEVCVAEDIVQELFIKLWERENFIREIKSLKSYLRYSIRNNAIRYLKQQQHFDPIDLNFIDDIDDNSEEFAEYITALQKALKKLPIKRKEILVVYITESLSYYELAERFDLSINTIKDHIKKAYAFLRTELNETSCTDLILFIQFSFTNYILS